MSDLTIVDTRDRPSMPYYVVRVYCRECDFGGEAKIETGTGSSHSIRRAICPTCKCRSLSRIDTPVSERFAAPSQEGEGS